MAGLLYFCTHTNASGIPIKAQLDSKVFKIYFLDIGLLTYLNGIDPTSLLHSDGEELINKGILAEQFIAQHLSYYHQGLEAPELFYWLRDKKNENAEIDFLIQRKNELLPIEVKAGLTGKLKSLFQFCYEKKIKRALVFSSFANIDLNENYGDPELVDYSANINQKIEKSKVELQKIHLSFIEAIFND